MRADNTIKAGGFLLLGLVLFAVLIIILGSERSIFGSYTQFQTKFRNIGGLNEGAPIRIGGITVGRVNKIGFSKDPSDPYVHVKFLIANKYLERVRRDSVVSIQTQGLLGDKFISLSVGMMSAAALAEGAELDSKEPADIAEVMSSTKEIVDHAKQIASNINEISLDFKKDTIDNISAAAKGFASIAEQIEKGDGLAHRLFYSKRDADKILNSITGASESLNNILTQVKSGKGALHALVYDENGQEFITALTSAANGLKGTSEEFTKIATDVREGQGLIHELIYKESPEIGDKLRKLVEDLAEAANSIKQASSALSNGSGTIGALLVDAKLYDNLVEVTDGAKRSFILRSAVRKALEHDQKEQR